MLHKFRGANDLQKRLIIAEGGWVNMQEWQLTLRRKMPAAGQHAGIANAAAVRLGGSTCSNTGASKTQNRF
jgi:hypothetical protein